MMGQVNYEVALGRLMKTKMERFEKQRRYTGTPEFYQLPQTKQDELLAENRKLSREINMLEKRIDELSHENNVLTNRLEEVTSDLEQVTHDGSLWLGDVIVKEQPKFGSNSLIVSPVGSGKTYAITNILVKTGGELQLILVSTTHLKNSLVADIKADTMRKQDNIEVYTTKDIRKYKKDTHALWVMTYAEFGAWIKVNENIIHENNITNIYCDEIHSLIQYKWSFQSEQLINAMRYLLQKHDGIQKYYFTATTEYMKRLRSENREWFANIDIYNYSKYPGIKKYTAMNEAGFTHIEQLRQVLRNHSNDFKQYGKKGLYFVEQIDSQLEFANMLTDEGFCPLVLWSTNNEKRPMSEEQLKALDELIETGNIPAPYDFLIINGAMREGWNLKDLSVELVIINSTSETDQIQARGRARKNVSTYMVRVDKVDTEETVVIPEDFMNTELTNENKQELLRELNMINDKGNLKAWHIVKKVIEKSGYEVKNKVKRIDGKQVRLSVIKKI